MDSVCARHWLCSFHPDSNSDWPWSAHEISPRKPYCAHHEWRIRCHQCWDADIYRISGVDGTRLDVQQPHAACTSKQGTFSLLRNVLRCSFDGSARKVGVNLASSMTTHCGCSFVQASEEPQKTKRCLMCRHVMFGYITNLSIIRDRLR